MRIGTITILICIAIAIGLALDTVTGVPVTGTLLLSVSVYLWIVILIIVYKLIRKGHRHGALMVFGTALALGGTGAGSLIIFLAGMIMVAAGLAFFWRASRAGSAQLSRLN